MGRQGGNQTCDVVIRGQPLSLCIKSDNADTNSDGNCAFALKLYSNWTAYIIGPWVCVLLSVSLCVFGVCVCSAPSVGGSLQPLITADSLQAEPLLCLKSLSNIFYPPFLKFLLPFPPLLIKKNWFRKIKVLSKAQTNKHNTQALWDVLLHTTIQQRRDYKSKKKGEDVFWISRLSPLFS